MSSEREPQPPAHSCGLCGWCWVNDRGWVPTWNVNCTVHTSPSDLL